MFLSGQKHCFRQCLEHGKGKGIPPKTKNTWNSEMAEQHCDGLTGLRLTWSRVGDGGCRHGDGNANTAAAAVLPAAATPAASTEGGERDMEEKEDIVLLRATCSDCTAGNCRYKDPAARVLIISDCKNYWTWKHYSSILLLSTFSLPLSFWWFLSAGSLGLSCRLSDTEVSRYDSPNLKVRLTQ